MQLTPIGPYMRQGRRRGARSGRQDGRETPPPGETGPGWFRPAEIDRMNGSELEMCLATPRGRYDELAGRCPASTKVYATRRIRPAGEVVTPERWLDDGCQNKAPARIRCSNQCFLQAPAHVRHRSPRRRTKIGLNPPDRDERRAAEGAVAARHMLRRCDRRGARAVGPPGASRHRLRKPGIVPARARRALGPPPTATTSDATNCWTKQLSQSRSTRASASMLTRQCRRGHARGRDYVPWRAPEFSMSMMWTRG